LSGNESLLDDIAPLWEQLNVHHLECSPDFKHYYRAMTFEKRRKVLLQKAADGEMRVDVAVDEKAGRRVGYCVSSVDENKTGEIESIFVVNEYRGLGIGASLLKTALVWMSAKGAEKKVVSVGAGNEQSFGFYERYGFRLRKTVLEQTENKKI
jgi:diamine N-acetyltransferase